MKVNLEQYFEEYPIVECEFLKVNSNENGPLYISKNDIKGFKITECSGEIFDISYTIEVIFDYDLFNYDIENYVPEIFKIKEIEARKETQLVCEEILKILYSSNQ